MENLTATNHVDAGVWRSHHPHADRLIPWDCRFFYGLGIWNVTFPSQRDACRLNHSGAFALGAATHVNLVPNGQLGIIVLCTYPISLAKDWV